MDPSAHFCSFLCFTPGIYSSVLCLKITVTLCVSVHSQLLGPVRLFETPWTVALQAPLSMECSRKGCWSVLPFPSWGNLPYPGIKFLSLYVSLIGRQIVFHYSTWGATATLGFPISNSSLQLRESSRLCLEFPSLPCRLEIAFRQESGTIRRLSLFVSLPSGTSIICCLFPMFVDFHLIYFVSFFSSWGWENKPSLLLYMARSRHHLQILLNEFFIIILFERVFFLFITHNSNKWM